MANFDAQIQDLVGTGFTDQTAMDTWMTEGARELINIFQSSPQLLLQCATESSLDHTVTTLTNMDSRGIIMGVTRDNGTSQQPCREIPPLYRERATDINDMMFYATEDDPVYYTWNNILSVIPVPTASQTAKVQHIAYPSINASDTDTISNFPDNAEYLVVLYAAKKALQQQLNTKSSSLPSDISAPVLASVGTSLPTYSAPSSFVLIPPPAGADVDLSSITFSFPTVPNKPVAVEQSITLTGTAPTYTPPVSAPDFADIDFWIKTEEDSEMAAARIQAVSQEIAKYSGDIQNELNEFNKENIEYQAKLQKDVQDGQLKESKQARDIQKYGSEIQAYSAEVGKETQRFQAEIAKALQKYQAETGYDLGRYSAEVQAQVQRFNSDLQKNSTDFMNNLQKYQAEFAKATADNQSTIAKYTQDLANFASKIQKHSTDYQWLQGQYAMVVSDYQQGVQALIGGGKQPQPQQQGGQ